MRRGADHLQELSAPRSPVWDEDDSLAADESGANEVEEERLQAQRDMQMVSSNPNIAFRRLITQSFALLFSTLKVPTFWRY